MAERRMFAKTIIDSDAFLDMPVTARLLYYDLGMRADDEGFVNNPKKIMRVVGATSQDLQILVANKFVIPFEDKGIIVIKHWFIHNYIRKDAFHETKYKEEKAFLVMDENNAYSLSSQSCDEFVTEPSQSCNKSVTGLSTQVRLGKDRLDKDRLKEDKEKTTCQQVVDLYHSICVSYPAVRSLSEARKKAINARLKIYNLGDFQELFEKAEKSSFLKGGNARNWVATFDWLIKDLNMTKVIDGNYDDRDVKNKKSQELDDFYQMAQAWAEKGE